MVIPQGLGVFRHAKRFLAQENLPEVVKKYMNEVEDDVFTMWPHVPGYSKKELGACLRGADATSITCIKLKGVICGGELIIHKNEAGDHALLPIHAWTIRPAACDSTNKSQLGTMQIAGALVQAKAVFGLVEGNATSVHLPPELVGRGAAVAMCGAVAGDGKQVILAELAGGPMGEGIAGMDEARDQFAKAKVRECEKLTEEAKVLSTKMRGGEPLEKEEALRLTRAISLPSGTCSAKDINATNDVFKTHETPLVLSSTRLAEKHRKDTRQEMPEGSLDKIARKYGKGNGCARKAGEDQFSHTQRLREEAKLRAAEVLKNARVAQHKKTAQDDLAQVGDELNSVEDTFPGSGRRDALVDGDDGGDGDGTGAAPGHGAVDASVAGYGDVDDNTGSYGNLNANLAGEGKGQQLHEGKTVDPVFGGTGANKSDNEMNASALGGEHEEEGEGDQSAASYLGFRVAAAHDGGDHAAEDGDDGGGAEQSDRFKPGPPPSKVPTDREIAAHERMMNGLKEKRDGSKVETAGKSSKGTPWNAPCSSKDCAPAAEKKGKKTAAKEKKKTDKKPAAKGAAGGEKQKGDIAKQMEALQAQLDAMKLALEDEEEEDDADGDQQEHDRDDGDEEEEESE